MFTTATKELCRLRAAIFGPSGSGKTYTCLRIAAGIGGRVAVIDSERRTASKYSDRFKFDVCNLEDRTIEGYTAAIGAAAARGYDVLIIDSLTHAWEKLVEHVERLSETKKYGGNYWSAWREGTPIQRAFVNALLEYPGHLLVTMRASTEWQTGSTSDGKLKPVRVGLKPEQGKGIEYEFDLLLEIDTTHIAEVIKDRTGKYQDKYIKCPDEDFGRALAAWLAEGATPRWIPQSDDELKSRVLEIVAISAQLGRQVDAGAVLAQALQAGDSKRDAVLAFLDDRLTKGRNAVARAKAPASAAVPA